MTERICGGEGSAEPQHWRMGEAEAGTSLGKRWSAFGYWHATLGFRGSWASPGSATMIRPIIPLLFLSLRPEFLHLINVGLLAVAVVVVEEEFHFDLLLLLLKYLKLVLQSSHLQAAFELL